MMTDLPTSTTYYTYFNYLLYLLQQKCVAEINPRIFSQSKGSILHKHTRGQVILGPPLVCKHLGRGSCPL
nr:hypothetical protein [Cressdnaviricota sp.]